MAGVAAGPWALGAQSLSVGRRRTTVARCRDQVRSLPTRTRPQHTAGSDPPPGRAAHSLHSTMKEREGKESRDVTSYKLPVNDMGNIAGRIDTHSFATGNYDVDTRDPQRAAVRAGCKMTLFSEPGSKGERARARSSKARPLSAPTTCALEKTSISRPSVGSPGALALPRV